MSTLVPPLLAGLVDDAAALGAPAAGVSAAVVAHRGHRAAWYAPLAGDLLVPASAADCLTGALPPVSLVGDVPPGELGAALGRARAAGARVRRVEAAVARRGEDPQPGLAVLRALAAAEPGLDVYAEIPLSWGLVAALDTVARGRAAGVRWAPKFRVGGLAAELFPTPVELAAVLCACRDRGLPFKLAPGLRRALRHTDPETGFTHHGVLNVLVAAALAAEGGEVSEVSEALAVTHPLPLAEPARVRRGGPRPLFVGYGAADVRAAAAELTRYGLLDVDPAPAGP